MDITGITLAQFYRWTTAVSRELYGGNVIVAADAHDTTAGKDGTPRCTARLAVTDSRGPGARTTANGRRGPYACWHAYRDVLSELFRRHPDAVIRAGNSWRVTYRGRDRFLTDYPATARVNVGSPVRQVTMPELCECPETDRVTATAVQYSDTMIPVLEHRLARGSLPERTREALERDLASRRRTARDASEFTLVRTTQPPEPAPFVNPFSDTDYVSPAVERATRVTAASAKLLGDKPLDPYVFGREYEDSPPHGYY